MIQRSSIAATVEVVDRCERRTFRWKVEKRWTKKSTREVDGSKHRVTRKVTQLLREKRSPKRWTSRRKRRGLTREVRTIRGRIRAQTPSREQQLSQEVKGRDDTTNAPIETYSRMMRKGPVWATEEAQQMRRDAPEEKTKARPTRSPAEPRRSKQ